MMDLLSGVGDVLGIALEPLEQADRLLAEAIEKMGQGIEFVGEQAQEFAAYLSGLAEKIDTLQGLLNA